MPAYMDPTKITHLTIHCAATPEGRDVKAEQINSWDVAKFGQVSYHWVIELDGTARRTLADDRRGAHVGRANTGNIGICYVGGMDRGMKKAKDTRTPEQMKAMETLVRTYLSRFPDLIVLGHRDWPGVAKDCPSFDVPTWIKERRIPVKKGVRR